MLLFSCCSDAPCELTDDDMEWLLEEYDSLYYLKNGTDTVVIPVETTFGQSEYDWEYGIRTGDNNYYGSYDCYLLDSTYYLHINAKACRDYIKIYLKNTKSDQIFRYNVYKDSVPDNKTIINRIEYADYFSLIEKNDSLGIKELYLAKKYGIIKILTTDSILFERIPQ